MPLYEVQLDRLDGDSEIRFTDVPLVVGEIRRIEVAPGRSIGLLPPRFPRAATRYACRELLQRAAEAKAKAAVEVERAAAAQSTALELVEEARALEGEARHALRRGKAR